MIEIWALVALILGLGAHEYEQHRRRNRDIRIPQRPSWYSRQDEGEE